MVVVDAEHDVVLGSFSIAEQCSSSLPELKWKQFTNRSHYILILKEKNLSLVGEEQQIICKWMSLEHQLLLDGIYRQMWSSG